MGVYGLASGTANVTNYGGYFKAGGQEGRGVYGHASYSGSATNYGGYFLADGDNGVAVYGRAWGSSGIGVSGFGTEYGGRFTTPGSAGQAVRGYATDNGPVTNYGGHFEAMGTYGRGIYAKGGPQGYAGEFDGKVSVSVLEITGGSDLSEQFDKDAVKPGMLVSIDAKRPGKLLISNEAYDNKVAGIISGAGGIKPGMMMGQKGSVADGVYPVALTGRVYCWADASTGAIQPGDLLTTSSVPGHAMKVSDHSRALGAIIGKAMTPLEKGKGLVLVLVSLQ
ncbi:hypothetical protein ES703_87859 [subsurface metagenome]